MDAQMVHDDEIDNEIEAWSSNRTSEWFRNLTIILANTCTKTHRLHSILARWTQYRKIKKEKKITNMWKSAVSKT